ncbi:hypothetical protein NC652_029665 [Populus alba x Populus x berolinensis]|nr:hypothetical protein NC652_029665 [Populus alba x Populus x berolinensis]
MAKGNNFVVYVYRALELLVAVNLTEHESFWKMRDACN